MSQKENLSPLAPIASDENITTSDIKVLKESNNVTKQQNVSLKQTTHISVKHNEKTNVVKKNFVDANTPSPPSTPKTNTTSKKSIVYQDSIEQPRKSISPMEKPILLVNEGHHIKIHHKKVKALTLPLQKNKDQKEEEEEVTRLKATLDKLQEKKDEKLTTIKEIKGDIKKVNEEIKSSKKVSHEIELIQVEKEEQNSILSELLEIMSEFSQDFKSNLLEHQERMASKEQQIQDLLNTLSEINYQLQQDH